jgi:hypothetical protein
MAAKQRIRAYGANMSSVNGLELTCEKQEADVQSKIISLELAKFEDGTKVTKAVYEEDDDIKVGHLSFEEIKTPTDVTSLKAIHKTKGDTFLFEGAAFIKDTATKLLVFRDRP